MLNETFWVIFKHCAWAVKKTSFAVLTYVAQLLHFAAWEMTPDDDIMTVV